MAITFKSFSTKIPGGDVLELTINAPASILTDDILIASISVNLGQPLGITAPAGWIEIFQSSDGSGTENRFAVFYKIATFADESAPSYTFSWIDPPGPVPPPGTGAAGGIALYSGVSTTDPINTFGFTTGDDPDSPASPDITTTRDNTLIVRTFGCDAESGGALPFPQSGTYPAGLNGRFAAESGTLSDVAVALADLAQASAGSTGTAIFTLDRLEEWVAGTIALNDESISSSSSSRSSSSSSQSSSSSSHSSSSSSQSSSSSASSSSSSHSSSSSSQSSSSSSSQSSSSSSQSSSSSSSQSSSSSSGSSSSSSSDLFIPAPDQIPKIIKGTL